MIDISELKSGENCVHVKNKEEYDYLMSELYNLKYSWGSGRGKDHVPNGIISYNYKAFIYLDDGYGRHIYYNNPEDEEDDNEDHVVFELSDIRKNFESFWEYYYIRYKNDKEFLNNKIRILTNINEKTELINQQIEVIKKLL